MSKTWRAPSVFFLSGFVLGCVLLLGAARADDGSLAPSERVRFENRLLREAIAHTQAGALQQALRHWLALNALDPANAHYLERIAWTRGEISLRAETRFAAAQADIKAGRTDSAINHLLGVLLLEPRHAQAPRLLRELEQSRVEAQWNQRERKMFR